VSSVQLGFLAPTSLLQLPALFARPFRLHRLGLPVLQRIAHVIPVLKETLAMSEGRDVSTWMSVNCSLEYVGRGASVLIQ
jgi:hypothetical protein